VTDPIEPAEPAGSSVSPGERVAEEEPPRPLVERLGLGFIALGIAALFGALSAAAVGSGELFLGVMAGIGALMTVWAAAATLRRW
jgi:hypothetical protein